MGSPFVYEDPLAPGELADRRDESIALLERTAELRNSRLECPRRYGKTSLIKSVLAEAQRTQGLRPLYVNFLGVLTAADVADRIEAAYAEQLEGSLRRWFSGVVRTLNPTLSGAPAGVGVKLSPTASSKSLLERLSLPRRLQQQHGAQCVIAFDEFQELVRAGAELPGVFRSELEQHGDVCAYIFSGSHPGMMRELFGTRQHAFFTQASPIALERLSSEHLAAYVGGRFERSGRDVGRALDPLLDLARGHPQRAMLLAHHLFEATPAGACATEETWLDTLERAGRSVETELAAGWLSLSTTEQKVMAVVAQRTVTLNGADARTRFGLPKTSSSRAAAETLERRGELIADRASATGWQIVDPLLQLWITNGRQWPTGTASR